jgi:hypothetical protein
MILIVEKGEKVLLIVVSADDGELAAVNNAPATLNSTT